MTQKCRTDLVNEGTMDRDPERAVTGVPVSLGGFAPPVHQTLALPIVFLLYMAVN